MKTVYRYEGKDGRGPYNCKTLNYSQMKITRRLSLKHEDAKHPSAYEDNLLRCGNGSKFACETLKGLKQWFHGYNTILKKVCDFNIVQYDVKKIIPGLSGRQCVFKDEDVINRIVIE